MMQNLLITGGCGFIGVNLIRHILQDTDFQGRIINVDACTYAGHPGSLSEIEKSFPERYVLERVNIVDREKLEKIFDAYEIDAVCHLAAESHVDRSIHEPDAFVQTNVMGTFNLLECLRERKEQVQRFHHVSTDEVFGSLAAGEFFDEDSPYKPNSPYSASKAGSDHLVRAYAMTYDLPVTISNCSNNYGPFQFPEKLIPLMILNARDGSALPVYGDGLQERDWIFVEDHVRGLWRLLIMEKPPLYSIFGGGTVKKNVDVVTLIADLVDQRLGALPSGPRRELIKHIQDRLGHDTRYAIDDKKTRSVLGWEPEMDFDTGLGKTVDWFLANAEWVEDIQSGAYRAWIKKHYGETAS